MNLWLPNNIDEASSSLIIFVTISNFQAILFLQSQKITVIAVWSLFFTWIVSSVESCVKYLKDRLQMIENMYEENFHCSKFDHIVKKITKIFCNIWKFLSLRETT